jgi:AcrR family transcriptional regulator
VASERQDRRPEGREAVEAGRPGGPAEGPGASAGRPRSEEAHQAILQATLQLLSDVGYSALTVEGVASRAGVGKATIYRRWPSKLPLVVEAFGQLPAFEDVDTGSLEGDVKTMLRGYLELFHKSPLRAVLPSLAGERASNPELAELFGPVMRGRREPLIRALERARDRGEVPAELDLGLASELLVGPIAVRLFFTGRSLHPDMVDPIVDLALEGLRRGGRRA